MLQQFRRGNVDQLVGWGEPGEVLKGKAADMEQSAFKTVIDLVDVSKLVELFELLKHLVVEECVAYSTPMAPTGKHRRAHLCRSSLCNP